MLVREYLAIPQFIEVEWKLKLWPSVEPTEIRDDAYSYWEMFEHDKAIQSSFAVPCHRKPLYHSNKKKGGIIWYKYRCHAKMFQTCFQQAEASHCIMATGKGEWQAAKWILMVQRSFTVHLCQDLLLVQLELMTSCLVMTLLSVAPCRPVDKVAVFREQLGSVALGLCDLASAEKQYVSEESGAKRLHTGYYIIGPSCFCFFDLIWMSQITVIASSDTVTESAGGTALL